MGKKSKTIKAVSKVIYDPNQDPGNYDVIFLDSDVFRCVPFNFLQFQEGGFIYDDSFIPGYKIRAVRNRKTGEYLVHRQFDEQRLSNHKWPTTPDFPIKLSSFFSEPELYRYSGHFLHVLTEKEDQLLSSPLIRTYLGKSSCEEIEGRKLVIINEVGPFQNTVITDQNIFRGLPSPLSLKKAKSIFPSYTRAKIYHKGEIHSCFQLKDHTVCVSNGSIIKEKVSTSDLSNHLVTHFLRTSEQTQYIGYTETKTHHFQIEKNDTPLFLGEENLESIGWRREKVIYLLHDFDFFPVKTSE